MHAAKKLRKLWKKKPGSPGLITLIELADALDKERDFPISQLYQLDYQHFELALELMAHWRLGRHTVARGKLIDLIQDDISSLDD